YSSVSMMMVSLFYPNWHYAAVGDLAVLMLELNRGVVNAKLHRQTLFHVAQYCLTCRWWNVGNSNVAGKRMHLRADAPDMEIVYIPHTVHLFHCIRQQVHAYPLRSTFQQYIERLANNAE